MRGYWRIKRNVWSSLALKEKARQGNLLKLIRSLGALLSHLSKIKDSRFFYFGKRLIYQNSPKTLSTEEYKKIHSNIAEKILSTEEVRWTTIPMAESLIDNIRNEKDISDEKLNYMNKVDEYIQQIRVFYEKAS